jgi:hypothetical protein
MSNEAWNVSRPATDEAPVLAAFPRRPYFSAQLPFSRRRGGGRVLRYVLKSGAEGKMHASTNLAETVHYPPDSKVDLPEAKSACRAKSLCWDETCLGEQITHEALE